MPLLVLLMPWALDHLRTVPLRTPPHSSQLLAEFASVRWNELRVRVTLGYLEKKMFPGKVKVCVLRRVLLYI